MIDLFPAPTVELPSARRWFYDVCLANFPQHLEEVIAWADAHYRVMTSDGEYFDSTRSPWLLEPLRAADDPLVSTVTFVKPIQTGGTSLGEIMLMRWILSGHGHLRYYWPTDKAAIARWNKDTERRLKACHAIRRLMPVQYEDGFIKFPNITFAMAGVFNSSNLDSDTVDFIINEEVHQWEKGMMQKARGRQTRVAFPKFINISNAGILGDQLHQEFNAGTQEHFMVKCPGCGQHHIMRTRWDDARPDLGGLRYDSEGCKRADGTFDYNKLVPSIRYQFPCGYAMPDDINARRLAAAGGKYSEPFNTGALGNRSFTYQAVACHEIRWLDLIQQKHNALRALKAGDDTDWRVYLQERESVFYDPNEHRPFQGAVVTTSGRQLNRQGLPGEVAKIWAADWQQGFKHLGELTHYWLVIESVLENCTSQVIYAGKVSDEMELLGVLKDHGITDADGGGIADGFIDASKNQKHILSFCLRHGINAVVGGDTGQRGFRWPDGSWQYFSQKKFIWRELNYPEPKYELLATREGWVEDPSEPYIIRYNKAGLLKNHFFLREFKANVLRSNPHATPDQYIERIIPEDIGEDYLKHTEAWERDLKATAARKMGEVEGFKQVRRADHLLSCTCYIDLMKDLSGLLGAQLQRLGIKPKPDLTTDEHR